MKTQAQNWQSETEMMKTFKKRGLQSMENNPRSIILWGKVGISAEKVLEMANELKAFYEGLPINRNREYRIKVVTTYWGQAEAIITRWYRPNGEA